MAKMIVGLQELVSCGVLEHGQILYLCDGLKSNIRVGNECATIDKDKLMYDGKEWDMSTLARNLCAKHGINYQRTTQGPRYWQTESGETIRDINIRYKRMVEDGNIKRQKGLGLLLTKKK